VQRCIEWTAGKGPEEMKKYILSPLCSAIIVPGLGQVLNKRVLKGLIIMGLVFILFIMITIKLALLIMEKMEGKDIYALNDLIEIKSLNGDLSGLWVMVAVFVFLWIYSIVDAFFDGLKIERQIKENPDEILSD
jgi:TM2 domain-containing membrane protein YozV